MSIWSADTLRALLAGDLHPLGGPAVAEPLASRVRAAQIGALARYTPGTMSCAVVAAPLVVMLFSDTAAGPYVLLWGFVVSCYSIYLYLRRRAARDGAPRHAVSISAAHRAVRNATLSGAIWAMLPLVALPFAPQHGSLLLCALVGVLGGGAFSLAPLPMAAIAFMAPLGIACAATLHYVESASSLFVIALIVIYVVALIRAVVMYGVQFANGVVQQATHEKAAITDALTGAPNRLGFEERCKAAAASAARLGDSYAVFSIDLDGLKSLNDEFGHAAGDEYLRQAAARMRACLREVDAMARLGGDEFAALGANMEKPQQAAALAQRILRAFEEPFIIGPRKLARTLSIGIAFLPGDGRDVEAVLAKADEALYVAKRQGGSGYRFYQDRDNFEVVSRRRIEEDLPHSIDSDQFDVEFQPFHKLSDLQLSGYEALLRWTHPTLGTVAPSSFIPLAESMGRIHALGERMAQRAIGVARAWPRGVRIAMNLSPAQLRAPHLPTSFERWMREAGLDPRMVELEITETAMMEEGLGARASLQTLRSFGVSIALDDFGVGYSSLAHVADLPIDRLKVDRALVQAALNSRRHAIVLEAAARMARDLGLATTAEGIETEGQLALMRGLGFDEGQGFLFGRPMSAAMVRERLARGPSVAAA